MRYEVLPVNANDADSVYAECLVLDRETDTFVYTNGGELYMAPRENAEWYAATMNERGSEHVDDTLPLASDDLEEGPTAVQYAPGFVFVNVYEVDRCYGGPEEGGWWYDAGRLVVSRQVPSGNAENVAAALREEYPNTGKYCSVIYAGGDYRVRIEDEPGRDFPEYTPHYE